MADFDIDRSGLAPGRAAGMIDAPLGLVRDRTIPIADWPQWSNAVIRTDASGPTGSGGGFR
ncbi:hypothetical protein [Pikeienuella sp. HZG-20]|uniref:hypothetical protein n=1 Tax=Paludibacillus litoralis TaxID=3133267 RepID=UPI0030EC51FB